MSYTKKVAFNTLAQVIGKIVGTAIAIVTTALLFRYFGVDGIGEYTTIFAFVGFFSVFADLGFQWTLLRELSVKEDHEKVFKNIFAFRLLLAVLIHALAFGLVWFFHYPLQVKLGVGIITIAWFFTTINSTLVAVYLNNYRLDITVSAEVVGRGVILGFVYLMIKAALPLNVVLLSYVFGNIVNFLINLSFFGRFLKFGLAYDFKYWKYIFGQALPIGIVLIFGFIYYKMDSLMLSWMKPMTDVGIYGTAYKLLEVLQTVPSMFLGAAFPLVTRYVMRGDERMKSAFQKQFDFLALMAVPIVVGTFILAGPIIEFIAGTRSSEFVNSSTVTVFSHPATSVTCLKILSFSIGISFFSNLYSYLIVSLGRQKSFVLPVIGFALLNVVLNLLFIPRLSYVGSSIATLTTEVIILVVSYFIAMRFVKLPLKALNALKILAVGLIMGLAIYYFDFIGLNLFVNIALAVLIYTTGVILLKAIPVDMVRQMLNKE